MTFQGKARKPKTLFLWLVPFVIPASVWVSSRISSTSACSEKVEVSIGCYSPWQSGQKPSFQRLAQEIKRCPKAKIIIIYRSTTPVVATVENQYFVVYNRDRHRLTDSHRATNDVDCYENVSDAAVEAVARQLGGFSDLTQFGAKHAYPYG